MLAYTTKERVLVERDEHGLKVVLREWGDKDYLDDQLAERPEIKEVWFSEEGEGKDEKFIIRFPDFDDQDALQKIIDSIE